MRCFWNAPGPQEGLPLIRIPAAAGPYSGSASYFRKYKRLRTRVEHFADLSEMEHLLAELPPLYWRKLAEAEAAKDRVRFVDVPGSGEHWAADRAAVGLIFPGKAPQDGREEKLRPHPLGIGRKRRPTPRNFTGWCIWLGDMHPSRCSSSLTGGSLIA